MDDATIALYDGLMDVENPRNYEQIFARVDKSQVIIVSGEHDNLYYPGYDPDAEPRTPVDLWAGLDEAGVVAKGEEIRFETPELGAGTYLFTLSGSNDADLYVRLGQAPTLQDYDCRPYKGGSDEVCEVEISAPTPLHVMVSGYAESSEWSLVGAKK